MLNLLHGSLLETWKDLVPLPNPLHTADGEAGRGLALVDTYSVLEKLVEFDKLIRVEFTHIIRMVAGVDCLPFAAKQTAPTQQSS